MTTPLIETLEHFDAGGRGPAWRLLSAATWAMVLVGGYLRFDRHDPLAGRLLAVLALAVVTVLAFGMLLDLIRRIAPFVKSPMARTEADAWDRDRRIAGWQRAKAAGAAKTILRGAFRRARLWTFLGYIAIVLAPGLCLPAQVGAVPLFFQWLIVVAVVAFLTGLLYSVNKWRRVFRAWARYEAAYHPSAH